jgi:hypothetical protein
MKTQHIIALLSVIFLCSCSKQKVCAEKKENVNPAIRQGRFTRIGIWEIETVAAPDALPTARSLLIPQKAYAMNLKDQPKWLARMQQNWQKPCALMDAMHGVKILGCGELDVH